MLNALLDVLVLGFVALAALGHILVFTAILFGKSESAPGALSRSITRSDKTHHGRLTTSR